MLCKKNRKFNQYKAKRMDDGAWIKGILIHNEDSPFAYILTKENCDRMIVDENGRAQCQLIRVLEKSVIPLGYSDG